MTKVSVGERIRKIVAYEHEHGMETAAYAFEELANSLWEDEHITDEEHKAILAITSTVTETNPAVFVYPAI